MEDNLSINSNESIATSEEFDFISDKPSNSRSPALKVVDGGDINSLASAMMEVLTEHEDNNTADNSKECSDKKEKFIEDDASNEKHDNVKDEESDEDEMSDVDQDCTIFDGITYLGAAAISAPKSDPEIQRNMNILNEQSNENAIKVSVSVPSNAQGVVILYDALTNTVISRYEIHRIIYYSSGIPESAQASCFAFTWAIHSEVPESRVFQCHGFRCDIAEAVNRVSLCFSKAFQRSMTCSLTSNSAMCTSITTLPDNQRNVMYVFEVTLEIKEDEGKNVFSTVAKDKSGFKLRASLDKQLCIWIRQVSDNGPVLHIERCFGVLLAAGRHVRHSDMRLLEMAPMNAPDKNGCNIIADWDPSDESFSALNVETPKDIKQYMTVAVDLVIRGIQEPVRFQIETLVKVFPQNERFWYFQKRNLVQQFFLNLKEICLETSDVVYEVISMDTSGELDRNRLNLALNLTGLINSPSINSIDTITPKEEYLTDVDDEPLLSGTGVVSKDCSEDVLVGWAEVLNKWHSSSQRPKQLSALVKLGIPEALRGTIWQRLAGAEGNAHLMETYRVLQSKDCASENVIQRDIARTFPAHDFFKEVGGLGQDSLYRVSKAYAVYDTEVGYCQGLSFLAATLLLHMPEEEAFCVLVRLMYHYGLRDMYKDGFDNLYLRLYQLNKLMEEQVGPLYQHFQDHLVETHMFASQWFLTLFTARFPLFFVFHIIDVFLLQGVDTLFQVALALLMMSKKDLLALDFEGILKYFRVSLPKKIRTEVYARELMKYACTLKVKKLKKYEAEFVALKEADNMEQQAGEVEQLRLIITRNDDERKLLLDEIAKLKQILKKEVDRAEGDQKNNDALIKDYKLVRHRLDSQLNAVQTELDWIKSKMIKCSNCVKHLEGKDVPTDSSNGKPSERIRDLELQLAKAKLAQVEAECKNQDLTHQLRTMENELTSAKNSWRPWLNKTLSTLKEAANKKDFPNFSYSPTGPTFVSHINPTIGFDGAFSYDVNVCKGQQGVLKDSASCSNLNSQN